MPRFSIVTSEPLDPENIPGLICLGVPNVKMTKAQPHPDGGTEIIVEGTTLAETIEFLRKKFEEALEDAFSAGCAQQCRDDDEAIAGAHEDFKRILAAIPPELIMIGLAAKTS